MFPRYVAIWRGGGYANVQWDRGMQMYSGTGCVFHVQNVYYSRNDTSLLFSVK